jgi:hypothetical protein
MTAAAWFVAGTCAVVAVAIVTGAGFRQASAAVDRAIAAANTEDAAGDEHLDRLIRARWAPLDQRDVDLWARQVMAADTATILREAQQ